MKYYKEIISAALIFFGFGFIMGGGSSGNQVMEYSGAGMLTLGSIYLIIKIFRTGVTKKTDQ